MSKKHGSKAIGAQGEGGGKLSTSLALSLIHLQTISLRQTFERASLDTWLAGANILMSGHRGSANRPRDIARRKALAAVISGRPVRIVPANFHFKDRASRRDQSRCAHDYLQLSVASGALATSSSTAPHVKASPRAISSNVLFFRARTCARLACQSM